MFVIIKHIINTQYIRCYISSIIVIKKFLTMMKHLNLFDLTQKVNYKTEILSGITVALALVPEAVAFALIAGLSPLTVFTLLS